MGNAPEITSAFASSARWVSLAWLPLEGATDVQVFRMPAFSEPFPLGWLSATAFTDQSAQPNTTYSYRICAYYGSDQGACTWSLPVHTPPEDSGTTHPTPEIDSVNSTDDFITVQWHCVHSYDHFNILWAEVGQPNNPQVEVGTGTGGSWSTGGLMPSRKYRVSVQGCDRTFWGNSVNCSGWSPDSIVTTLPAPILPATNVVATAQDATTVRITWGNASGADVITVIRKPVSSSPFGTWWQLPIGTVELVDVPEDPSVRPQLQPRCSYIYTVTKSSSDGSRQASAESNIVTTPARQLAPPRHSGYYIQSAFGHWGNYELVVPMGDHLAHYWRDNDSVGYPWHGPIVIPGPYHGPEGKDRFQLPVEFSAVSLLQSSLGPGNLDLVSVAKTATGDGFLIFYGRETSGWHGPTNLIAEGKLVAGVTGAPALIQSAFGHWGNYELVVPMGDHLAHYWRDNDSVGYPWHGPIVIPGPYHGPEGKDRFQLPVEFSAVSLLQSSLGPGNLDLVSVAKTATGDGFLIFYGRDASGWHGPTNLIVEGRLVTGVTGAPALIQSTYGNVGNYELVVPMGDHLAHYWRDNDSVDYPWHGPIVIPGPYHGPEGKDRFQLPVQFLSAALVESNLINGRLEVIAVATSITGLTFLIAYTRDSTGWHMTYPVADTRQITGMTV